MAVTIELKSDRINAGSPYSISAAFSIPGGTITGVSMLLADTNNSKETIETITTPVTLTFSETRDDGKDLYTGTLESTETVKLLNDPLDQSSPLKHSAVVAYFQVSGTNSHGGPVQEVFYETITNIGRNPF